jgi:sulfur-oxidizing protein SoxY
MQRRSFLAMTGALALAPVVMATPARAVPADVKRAMAEFFGDQPMTKGRVKLEIPNLVENGNVVSVTLSADAGVGSARIASLHLFADENPLPNVGNFYFGPRSGQPKISTRIRLATTQNVWLVGRAEDGSLWTDGVEVLVTLAACIE